MPVLRQIRSGEGEETMKKKEFVIRMSVEEIENDPVEDVEEFGKPDSEEIGEIEVYE